MDMDRSHGDSPMKAVENSLILDEICLMAKENELINPNICEIRNIY